MILIYVNFTLIYVEIIKKKKTFYGRTDGQPKTIVRNLTIARNLRLPC
jgi:hypothetical protein